jgi:hypothetical protein
LERHQPRLEQLPVTEPAPDLLVLPPAPAAERADEQLLALDCPSAEYRKLWARHAEAGERQVAARRHGIPQLGHNPIRVGLVLHVVHDREQQQADGPPEVDQLADNGIGQDLRGLAHVADDDVGGPLVGEQRLAVRVDDRVVVDVHDVDRRVDRVRHLADVALRGQPGTEIEELGNSGPCYQELDRPAEERAVVLR